MYALSSSAIFKLWDPYPIFGTGKVGYFKFGVQISHHGLCSSASPVLTATGFVNGKWQLSTPYRIDTP